MAEPLSRCGVDVEEDVAERLERRAVGGVGRERLDDGPPDRVVRLPGRDVVQRRVGIAVEDRRPRGVAALGDLVLRQGPLERAEDRLLVVELPALGHLEVGLVLAALDVVVPAPGAGREGQRSRDEQQQCRRADPPQGSRHGHQYLVDRRQSVVRSRNATGWKRKRPAEAGQWAGLDSNQRRSPSSFTDCPLWPLGYRPRAAYSTRPEIRHSLRAGIPGSRPFAPGEQLESLAGANAAGRIARSRSENRCLRSTWSPSSTCRRSATRSTRRSARSVRASISRTPVPRSTSARSRSSSPPRATPGSRPSRRCSRRSSSAGRSP